MQIYLPDILGETPAFRETRVPSKRWLITRKAEGTLEDFLAGFPAASREALEEAKELLLARP